MNRLKTAVNCRNHRIWHQKPSPELEAAVDDLREIVELIEKEEGSEK
jgi:hypothetical protein